MQCAINDGETNMQVGRQHPLALEPAGDGGTGWHQAATNVKKKKKKSMEPRASEISEENKTISCVPGAAPGGSQESAGAGRGTGRGEARKKKIL